MMVTVSLLAAALGQSPVRYDVDLSRAPQQLIGVTMTIPDVPAQPDGTLDVHLPVWRPGMYVLVEQSGTVRDVSAASGSTTLPIEKVDKATWRIRTDGGGEVKVAYTVFAASLENRTRHADESHVFMSPSTVFMYAPQWRQRPAEININVPQAWIADGWKLATGLPSRQEGSGWAVTAKDYDRLVDSPIEVGLHDTRTFDVDGVPHEIVVWTGLKPEARTTAGVLGELDKYKGLPDAFQKIVVSQRAIFGSLPYERYVFLIHAYPGGRGGTEHWNSTIMQTAPDAFLTERYDNFLELAAHEFFHTWNVKRFRPAGITPYDYQRENYSDLLWLVEGTTTYYEQVALSRVGMREHKKVFDGLAGEIDRERNAPGARVQSVAAASFDAWVSGSKLGADQINSTVSIYGKGMLASFYIDMWIRDRNEESNGLDDVVRELMATFGGGGGGGGGGEKGYTTADVKAAVARTSKANPAEVDELFARVVNGTELLDPSFALGVVGLELKEDPKTEGTLGITTSESNGSVQIATVLTGLPASKAGLLPGDVLLAIDGVRIRGDGDKAVSTLKAGDKVKLTFFRRDTLREAELEVASKPAGKVKVQPVASPTARQTAMREKWLGKSKTDKPKGPESNGP